MPSDPAGRIYVLTEEIQDEPSALLAWHADPAVLKAIFPGRWYLHVEDSRHGWVQSAGNWMSFKIIPVDHAQDTRP